MSYQPPSDEEAGMRPTGEGSGPGDDAPVTPSEEVSGGGSSTMPMGGGSAQSGGYMAPPSGDFDAQPSQSDYTPPPEGAYTPPPPPTPSGGYSPPPPPPPTGGATGGGAGMGNMNLSGGLGAGGIQGLFQSWMNAVTKPNVATYEGEIPKASLARTLVGVAAVAVVNMIIGIIAAGAVAATMNQLRDQLRAQGRSLPFDPGLLSSGGGIASLITTPITFFLGAGLLYLMAKMLGGQGRDFMTHAYLLSLSYAPLGILSGLVGIIPILGSLVALALTIYRLYSQGLSMQASQNMQPGRAQLAAFLPSLIGFVLVCLCVVLAFMGLMAAAGGAVTNP